MLLTRHFERLLLARPISKPLARRFRGRRGFQPRGDRGGRRGVLLVRVAERPRERRAGFTALPRWVPGEGLTIDWLPDDEIEVVDPRVVRRKADGLVRLTFISHLRVVRCGDGRSVEEVTDVRFLPDSHARGIWRRGPADHSDRRPVFLHLRRRLAPRRGDGAGFHDRLPPLRSARDDLLPREQGRRAVPGADRWAVRGASSPERGDAVLPPRDVGRPVAGLDPLGPARVPSRRRLPSGRPAASVRGHRRFVSPTAGSRSTTATAGRPDPARWARIRPACCCSTRTTRRTCSGARRSRSSSRRPISSAHGFVPDVVFPTGIVGLGDSFLIYYGAADSCTAVVEFSKDEVLQAHI